MTELFEDELVEVYGEPLTEYELEEAGLTHVRSYTRNVKGRAQRVHQHIRGRGPGARKRARALRKLPSISDAKRMGYTEPEVQGEIARRVARDKVRFKTPLSGRTEAKAERARTERLLQVAERRKGVKKLSDLHDRDLWDLVKGAERGYTPKSDIAPAKRILTQRAKEREAERKARAEARERELKRWRSQVRKLPKPELKATAINTGGDEGAIAYDEFVKQHLSDHWSNKAEVVDIHGAAPTKRPLPPTLKQEKDDFIKALARRQEDAKREMQTPGMPADPFPRREPIRSWAETERRREAEARVDALIEPPKHYDSGLALGAAIGIELAAALRGTPRRDTSGGIKREVLDMGNLNDSTNQAALFAQALRDARR